MNKFSNYIPGDAKAYKFYGKSAKSKILQLIKMEEISVEKSFDYSLIKQASYLRKEYNGNFESDQKNFNHTIIVPMFTDASYMKQAIVLAHELAHFYVLKEASEAKEGILLSGFKITTYIHEKITWNRAKIILEDEGIIQKGGNELQDKAFEVFVAIKKECLKTYNPISTYSKNIINPILKTARLWISSYLIVAAWFILAKNQIPLPVFLEIQEIKTNDIYNYTWFLFYLKVFSLLIIKGFTIKIW